MSNNLQVFENERFGEVRVQVIDEKPYFNLSDVCLILGLSTPSKVKSRLNQKGVTEIHTLTNGGNQLMNYIDESNLYKCIFRSNKKEAEEFTDWVTSEVLPAIRKTGMYATDELLNNPDLAIKAFTRLKEEQEKRKQLEAQIIEQAPKIEFYNDVTGSETTAEIGTVAKLLNFKGIGRNTLFEILRKQKVLQYNNQPYQKYLDCGYFRIIESKWSKPNGDIQINFKTVVYQKGIQFISNILKRLGYVKNEEEINA